jgi:alpha-tubulin suppressor-like RCC1 family protein
MVHSRPDTYKDIPKGDFIQIRGLPEIARISIAERGCAALDRAGKVWWWDDQADSVTVGEEQPKEVTTGEPCMEIACGRDRLAMILRGGAVAIRDKRGRLSLIPDLPAIKSVRVGGNHLAMLDRPGRVWLKYYGEWEGIDAIAHELHTPNLGPMKDLAFSAHDISAINESGVAFHSDLYKPQWVRSTIQKAVFVRAVYAGEDALLLDSKGKIWSWSHQDTVLYQEEMLQVERHLLPFVFGEGDCSLHPMHAERVLREFTPKYLRL